MRMFVGKLWAGVPITALAMAFCISGSNAFAEGINAGLGLSIGGKDGINAGLGASVGGKNGVKPGLGATTGGKNGINAGAGTSVGGKNGVTAGLGISIGGKTGITGGGGASIGGKNGVTAGLGASVGGKGGINAGAGVGIGKGVGVDVGLSIGGDNDDITADDGTDDTTDKPRVVIDTWRDPRRPTDDDTVTKHATGSTRQLAAQRVAGMSSGDVLSYKKRCVEILANARSYDAALVALCRAVRGM